MSDAKMQDRTIAIDIDSCDCGGGYPCSHGQYISSYRLDEPKPDAARRATERGEEPPYYAYLYDEVVEFPDWLHARIYKSAEMVACLERLAIGEGDPEEASRLLADLERHPIDIENDIIGARIEAEMREQGTW